MILAIERASLLIEHPRYKGRYSDACKPDITIPKDAISFRGRKRQYVPGLSSALSPWSGERIFILWCESDAESDAESFKLGWRDKKTFRLKTSFLTGCKGIIDLSHDDADRLKEMVKSFTKESEPRTFTPSNSKIEIKIDNADFERCYSWTERAEEEAFDVETSDGERHKAAIYKMGTMPDGELFRMEGDTNCERLVTLRRDYFKFGGDLFKMNSQVSVQDIQRHELWLFVESPIGSCHLANIRSEDDIPKTLKDLQIQMVFTTEESEEIIGHTVKDPEKPETDQHDVEIRTQDDAYIVLGSDTNVYEKLKETNIQTFFRHCIYHRRYSTENLKDVVSLNDSENEYILMHYQCRIEIFKHVPAMP